MEFKTKRMKKSIILILFVLSSVLTIAQTSVWDGRSVVWNNGTGLESDPYLIESAGNLAFLAYMVNKGYETDGLFFRLTTDLDLGGENWPWEPIGLGDRWANEDGCDRGVLEAGTSFNGHFDGGGHSIYNIFVDDRFTYGGLFGSVVGQSNSQAVIENVFVVSGTIQGNNCGGIVGKGSFTQVSRCWNGANVEGNSSGGIMGWANNSTINNSYSIGNLAGMGDNSVVGGLVGVAQNTVQVTNSYFAGIISDAIQTGCLVGDGVNGTITVENCHYLNTCSQSGYGLSQSETFMRELEFVILLNGQNAEPVWAFDASYINNGFPILAENVCLVEVMSNPPDGGISQGGCAFPCGSSCTVVAEANPHYVFVNWTENGEVVAEEETYTFMVEHSQQLVANFIINDGIDDLSSPVRVFPNPARDVLFIESVDVCKVLVLNMLGQVFDEIEGRCHWEINLGKYPSGVYVVKAQQVKRNTLIRFVKL